MISIQVKATAHQAIATAHQVGAPQAMATAHQVGAHQAIATAHLVAVHRAIKDTESAKFSLCHTHSSAFK